MPATFVEQATRFLNTANKATLAKALNRCSSRKRANEIISSLTGIAGFLSNDDDWTSFRSLVASKGPDSLQDAIQEYGDFQTPLSLAKTVCEQLFQLGHRPTLLLEPTCGRGNFILAALNTFPSLRRVYGLEIQESYVTECKSNLLAHLLNAPDLKREIHIKQGNIFDDSAFSEFSDLSGEQILILGNPPWVTNTMLSGLNSSNLPAKSNFKGRTGLDAITGKSNFDICEFILLQLIRNFSRTKASIAMLCKNIVVRNLVEATKAQDLPISNLRAFTFDAGKEFNVACDASLFVADITGKKRSHTCSATELRNSKTVRPKTFGWVEENFVADVEGYVHTKHIEGISPLVWRQGIKHDCAEIMELEFENGRLQNGKGEVVDVETDRVFPLAKSSDLKLPIISKLRKFVVVPQNFIGEDTNRLQRTNPRLWKYLSSHAPAFAARKSSIYKDKPPFSIFGVGDYSFKPYKVAMSGMYKSSTFSLLLPIEGKPAMLDDTCYLLGFDALEPTLISLALLNSEHVQEFLRSIIFLDSKRPYTKGLLMRIDLRKVASLMPRQQISDYLLRIGAPQHDFEELDLEFFKQSQPLQSQALLAMEQVASYSSK